MAGTSGYKYVIRAYRTVENLTFESAKIISGSINYPPLPALSVLTATPTPARNSMSFTWTLPANSPLNDTAYNYDGYVIDDNAILTLNNKITCDAKIEWNYNNNNQKLYPKITMKTCKKNCVKIIKK